MGANFQRILQRFGIKEMYPLAYVTLNPMRYVRGYTNQWATLFAFF
jgi:hypothetical protein